MGRKPEGILRIPYNSKQEARIRNEGKVVEGLGSLKESSGFLIIGRILDTQKFSDMVKSKFVQLF